MSRFYLCEYMGARFFTKLCFYRKTAPEIYDKSNALAVVPQTDAEIGILFALKAAIIEKNFSPCILELVYAKICDTIGKITPREKVCDDLVARNTPEMDIADDIDIVMCKYSDLIKNGLAYDKCAFLVLERCDITLDEYLRRSTYTPVGVALFKSILFMIIYTMQIIRIIFPKARHYDLHTENIMLKIDPNFKYKPSEPMFLVFQYGVTSFTVPYFGVIPKIIDFGFSTLPEKNIVSSVTEDRAQMYHRSDNDLLILMHWINNTIRHSSADKSGKIDGILAALEPTKSYIQYYAENIRKRSKEIPTYETMLGNDVFKEYKKVSVNKSQIYSRYDSAI